jgi:hypothetical protein
MQAQGAPVEAIIPKSLNSAGRSRTERSGKRRGRCVKKESNLSKAELNTDDADSTDCTDSLFLYMKMIVNFIFQFHTYLRKSG